MSKDKSLDWGKRNREFWDDMFVFYVDGDRIYWDFLESVRN